MQAVERVESHGAGGSESVILYDASLVDQPDPRWFEPAHWPDALSAPGYAGGRGKTLFVRCAGIDCVLRHYRRGGYLSLVAADGFLWLGAARNRAFVEWRLLARLQSAGLPVPRPFAARYLRQGLLYRADLITVRLPDVVPLSTRLATGAVSHSLWQAVGVCIGRFHAAGFDHADLTAHNLQVDPADTVFLLDFDRGRERAVASGWRRRNLARLRRSLEKISGDGSYRFDLRQWQALLDGYRAVGLEP
jgi:3-deoxy-D-manno-octulosonic acid kinase